MTKDFLKTCLAVAAMAAAGTSGVDAKVNFARIFSDNMVLQHDAVVKVHGTAAAGSEVKLTAGWHNNKLKTQIGRAHV